VYRTNEGKPWVLPVVSSTETALAADKTLNHEYLSIDGMKEFYTTASKLILGADSPAIVENRVGYYINNAHVSCESSINLKLLFLIRWLSQISLHPT
jgi:aspartate/tyrosine/aromatic aminotransferase